MLYPKNPTIQKSPVLETLVSQVNTLLSRWLYQHIVLSILESQFLFFCFNSVAKIFDIKPGIRLTFGLAFLGLGHHFRFRLPPGPDFRSLTKLEELGPEWVITMQKSNNGNTRLISRLVKVVIPAYCIFQCWNHNLFFCLFQFSS